MSDAPAPSPTQSSAPRCSQVLLIEDDKLVAKFIERLLVRQGYDVTWAHDGETGLERMRLERFPLVITDWNMPGISGLDVARAARGDESIGFTYLIMLTGNTEADAVTEAFDAGVDDFIHKPIAPPELKARLQAAQRIIALEQDLAQQNMQAFRMNAELAVLNDQLDHIANYDALTEVFNRKAGIERLDESIASADRRGKPLSVLMVDVDKFKTLNDEHGHDAGDLGVHWVAHTIQSVVPEHGTACRLGGDEFLAVLPDFDANQAAALAEKLRHNIETAVGKPAEIPKLLTLSIGLATREPSADYDRTQFLRHADEAMYASKRSGRNRVSLANAA